MRKLHEQVHHPLVQGVGDQPGHGAGVHVGELHPPGVKFKVAGEVRAEFPDAGQRANAVLQVLSGQQRFGGSFQPLETIQANPDAAPAEDWLVQVYRVGFM